MSKSKSALVASLDEFTAAYIRCALWSSTNVLAEEGADDLSLEALGCSYEDIALATLREMVRDCRDFQRANRADLIGWGDDQAGYDFWLTRNGHGAGFWDRGRGAQGERLSAASKPYGSVNLGIVRGKVVAL